MEGWCSPAAVAAAAVVVDLSCQHHSPVEVDSLAGAGRPGAGSPAGVDSPAEVGSPAGAGSLGVGSLGVSSSAGCKMMFEGRVTSG